MDTATILPIGSMEKAICLPEVLTCIFSWLKDERYTLRCVRLVSRRFLATANQFFRVHLTADYAIEHNCIQEAAAIIGGLTLTFPRVITEEASVPSRHLGLEPQGNIVSLAFCSMVARNCVHLETVKIALEGPHSEEISRLLSCLFSQDPDSAAVFRIKSLEFVFGFKFVETILQDIRDSNLPDSCTGQSSTMNYIPTESPFARLEKLKLLKKFMVELPLVYRILQLKICPEVAAATSFLGPVYWNRMEREARLPTASSMARPSRTLKIIQIPNTLCSLDELYSLKEQAPELEEVEALTICNTNESITNEAAFARDSTRAAGTLRLKKLTLSTTMDQEARLLLCRLFDLSVLESYITNFIYSYRPPMDNAGFLARPAPSNILNEMLDEMRVASVSGRPQGGFLRELGFNSCDLAIERVDWFQRLKDIPRLHRLESLSLPLTIDGFLDIFDTPIPLSTDAASNTDLAIAATAATTAIATSTTVAEEEGPLMETPQQSLSPFPACSSLLSFGIGGCDSRIIAKGSGRRLADYLIRNLPRLKHLHIPQSSFTDLTFLDAIAPSTLSPPAPSSSSSPLPSPSLSQEDSNQNDGSRGIPSQDRDRYSSERMPSQDRERYSSCSNSPRSHPGLYQLESLTISFNFMTQSEFQKLPMNERVVELVERRDGILERLPQFGPEHEEFENIMLIETALQIEVQRMLLEARTTQYHEDQMEQFLAILHRFQRKKNESWFIDDERVKRDSADPSTGVGGDVAGLKRMVVSQIGMPKVYEEKLKARVASQFPELDFKITGSVYQL